MGDLLFLLSPADQHTLSGEIIGNGLVLSLLESEKHTGRKPLAEQVSVTDKTFVPSVFRCHNICHTGKLPILLHLRRLPNGLVFLSN